MPPISPVPTADRILDVAERLVQVHGFNAFSYADISAELGIRKASLHHHFPTKAGLGMALITRYHDRFREALGEISANTVDALARLQAYVRLYGKVLRNQRMCLCGVLAADFETLPPPMREGVLSFFVLNEEWLTRVLEEGRQTGSLRFEGPPARLAAFLVSSLEGAMLLARSYGKVSRFEAVAKKLLGDLATDAER
ncbi:MAG TPA: TetR/AcrR family transcriptional regulator [Polyangiaceae bacterium]|nr:TetR/AcrR family transcriptional regulator [Polyangiaceae bacterium]